MQIFINKDLMWECISMKMRCRIIISTVCVALIAGACSKKALNDGEERKTTVNTVENKENKNQSKLDVVRPMAYADVDNLNLEPGSYISIIGRNSSDSYWNEVKAGAERAVADINGMLGYKGEDKVRLNFSGPSVVDSVDEQINILDEELARYPIAVGISASDASACKVQFDLAAENDIPIVAFDSGSEYQGVVATCSTNNQEASRTAAAKLANLMEEKGEAAVFVQDSKSMTAKDREKGFVDEITESHPEVKTVSIYHMDELEEKAKEIAEEKNAAKAEGEAEIQPESLTQEDIVKYIIEKHPQLKGIYATNLDTTKLVTDVISKMEKKDLKVVGFDGGSAQMKLLEEGKLNGLIVQNPYGMGYATVVAAARDVLGLGNEAVIDSSYTWVTKDNMKKNNIKRMLY